MADEAKKLKSALLSNKQKAYEAQLEKVRKHNQEIEAQIAAEKERLRKEKIKEEEERRAAEAEAKELEEQRKEEDAQRKEENI